MILTVASLQYSHLTTCWSLFLNVSMDEPQTRHIIVDSEFWGSSSVEFIVKGAVLLSP